MVKLNENASVPGIPILSDIGSKPLMKPIFDGGLKMAAPITIDTSGRPPGAARRFKDYIPSVGKRRNILRERGVVVEEKEESVHTHHVVRHKGHDYLSAKDSAKRRETQDSEIMKLAREIWDRDSTHRKKIKEAKKIASNASDKELESPSPRLKKALDLMDGKKPITKDQAIRQARAKIYRE